MYCSRCGTQLYDEAKFCPNCGTAVVNNINSSANQQSAVEIASSIETISLKSPKSKKLKYIIIGIVCLLLTAGIIGTTLGTLQVNSFFKLVEAKSMTMPKQTIIISHQT